MSFRMRKSAAVPRTPEKPSEQKGDNTAVPAEISFQPAELKSHSGGKYRYTPSGKGRYRPKAEMPKDPNYYLGNQTAVQPVSYDDEKIVYDKEAGKWKIIKVNRDEF